MSTFMELLGNSAWATHFSEGELFRIASEMHTRHVPAEGFVVRVGEPADYWIGVIHGFCKMSITSPEGRTSTFTGVTAGGWFGEGTLLKRGVWRYDAIALRDMHIACMPRATFERLLATNLGFNRFIMNMLNARLSLFIGLVEYDRLLNADARVARCLASLFDPDLYPHQGLYIELNQEEIGLLSAVSRQRANLALRRLEEAQLIRIEFRGITVLDLPGLRNFNGPAGIRHVLRTKGSLLRKSRVRQ